jgi:hypothetical protein
MIGCDEAPFDKLSASGLSVDYIARETRRAIADAGHSIEICASAYIEVPIQSGWSRGALMKSRRKR